MPQALNFLSFTQVGRIPISHFHPSPLWGNKNWLSSMKVNELKKLGNKIGSKGCKWSNLNAPGTQSSQVGRIPLSHFQPSPLWGTVFPAYSDTLGTWEKCHCNQIVTVTRGSLVTNQSFGTCQKCHCKRGVTVNSVTVSGEICILKHHENLKIQNFTSRAGSISKSVIIRNVVDSILDSSKL